LFEQFVYQIRVQVLASGNCLKTTRCLQLITSFHLTCPFVLTLVNKVFILYPTQEQRKTNTVLQFDC